MPKPTRTILMPTLVVFSAVMLLVVISFFMSRNAVRQELHTKVTDYTNETESTIRERLSVFEVTLQAAQGLISGNPTITEQQWQQFVNTSTVLARYPSARALNYAKIVKQSDLPSFLPDAQTRAHDGFHITPEGSRDSYTVILFMSPETAQTLPYYGYDIASDPTRRAAFERARDTGQITASDILTAPLQLSNKADTFIMYAPQYEPGMPTATTAERQQAIRGYTYVGFNVNDFMSSVNSVNQNPNVAFIIKNGNSGKELYRSSSYDNLMRGTHQLKDSSISIGSTTFQITYVYNPNTLLSSASTERPVAILVFGLLVAMLIALTVWLVLASKANELLLEQERGINDAKDNLLSLASHQLRTPATGVKQYLGLVLQGFTGDITPRQQSMLEKAYESNERQLKTINDILYVARLGSGRIVLTKTVFSISDLVKDIVHEVSDDIKDKQHKVVLKVPKREKLFYGDEHMIRMAVENLLSNAIKYTHKKGKITLRVSFGPELQILVEDNGVGIPDDQQEEMFQQFVRIDNELSIVVGGTGIGLYVVKNIAHLHKGRIMVSSTEGKGSRFTLILPFLKQGKNDKV